HQNLLALVGRLPEHLHGYLVCLHDLWRQPELVTELGEEREVAARHCLVVAQPGVCQLLLAQADCAVHQRQHRRAVPLSLLRAGRGSVSLCGEPGRGKQRKAQKRGAQKPHAWLRLCPRLAAAGVMWPERTLGSARTEPPRDFQSRSPWAPSVTARWGTREPRTPGCTPGSGSGGGDPGEPARSEGARRAVPR